MIDPRRSRSWCCATKSRCSNDKSIDRILRLPIESCSPPCPGCCAALVERVHGDSGDAAAVAPRPVEGEEPPELGQFVSLPHHVQALSDGKIDTAKNRAPWPPTPELPPPRRPATKPASSSLVHPMLPQQQYGHRQEPHRQLLDYLRLNWLLTTEFLHPLLKLFTEQPAPHFLHTAYRHQPFSTVCTGRASGTSTTTSPSMISPSIPSARRRSRSPAAISRSAQCRCSPALALPSMMRIPSGAISPLSRASSASSSRSSRITDSPCRYPLRLLAVRPRTPLRARGVGGSHPQP